MGGPRPFASLTRFSELAGVQWTTDMQHSSATRMSVETGLPPSFNPEPAD